MASRVLVGVGGFSRVAGRAARGPARGAHGRRWQLGDAAVLRAPLVRLVSTTRVAQQKKAKKGKGGAGAAAAPTGAGAAAAAADGVVPINIMKEGADPELKDESEYPEWLWEVLEEKPSLMDLALKGADKLTPEEAKLLISMVSTAAIKESNLANKKLK